MKYKLVNHNTKEETICDKVVVDEFDYYVSNEKVPEERWYISPEIKVLKFTGREILGDKLSKNCKKIVATNNPNIDIPKVVDPIEILLENYYSHKDDAADRVFYDTQVREIIKEYQETLSNSDEDAIEFAKWIADTKLHGYCKQLYEAIIRHKVSTVNELIKIWKEQQPKIVYYE